MAADKVDRGSFAPGSGLKDDWDGTIREVVFEKQENSTNFAAHVVSDADDGEEVETFAGLGGDWASYDGGATVEHPKGATRSFHANTMWSKLLVRMFDAVVAVEGAEDNEMQKRDRAHEGRGAQIGETFAGLRFHWEVMTVKENRPEDLKDAEGKPITGDDGKPKREWKEVDVDRMFPTAYLGVAGGELHPQTAGTGNAPANQLPGDGSQAPQPPEAQQPTQPQASPATDPGAGAAAHPAIAGIPEKDRVKLGVFAKTKDFSGFVDAVMDFTGSDGRSMLEVPEVIQALSDENFYLALRG